MTQERTRTHGVVTPSLTQLLLAAMLCAFARLVSGAVSTLQMIRAFLDRDWHATEESKALPRETSGNQSKDKYQAEPTGLSTGNGLQAVFPATCPPKLEERRRKAGIQTPREVRTRNAQTLSPLMPTHVGIQGRPRRLARKTTA